MLECPEAVPLFFKRLRLLGISSEVLEEAQLTSLDIATLMKCLAGGKGEAEKETKK